MESRLLDGDEKLFEKMRHKTHASKIWPSRKFFAAKRHEQIARHHRFDDTAYNLEPNVKEGPGGLRDIQMISWSRSGNSILPRCTTWWGTAF